MNRKLIIKKDSVEAVDYIENPGLGGMLDDFATGELDGVVAGEDGLELEEGIGSVYYDDGIENVEWVEGEAKGSYVRRKESNHLYLQSGGGSSTDDCAYETEIDLTNIEKIVVNCTKTGDTNYTNRIMLTVDTVGQTAIGAPSGGTIQSPPTDGVYGVWSSRGNVVFDVSENTGICALSVISCAHTSATARITYLSVYEIYGLDAEDKIIGIYSESGSRTSLPLDLSSLGKAKTSEISWQTTEPDDTSVKVLTAVTEEEEVFEVSRTEEGAGFEDGVLDGVVAGEEGLGLEQTMGKALSFDGVDDYVEKKNFSISVDSVTVETKIYLPKLQNSYKGLVCLHSGGSGTGWGDKQLQLQYSENHTMLFQLNMSDGAGGTTVSTGSTLKAGNEYHIAGVRDKSKNKLFIYINGILEGEVNETDSTWAITNGLLTIGLGNYYNGVYDTRKHFEGVIDDVRIWNTARTQQQIQDNMNKELTGNETGLVGYWKFNEGEGTTAYDSAGSNHGTIYGATWVDGIVGRYLEQGSRTSLPLDLSGLGQAVSSYIEWDATIPEDTTLTVETGISEDAETEPATWDEATSGQPIPSISANDDLTGKYLWVRQTLETEDETVTPTLHSLTVTVEGDTAIGVALDPEENDWEEQENGQLITNLPESMIGKYLWLKQVLETTDTSVTPTLHWLALNWNKTAMRLTKDALIVRGKFIEGGNEVKLDKYDFYAPEFKTKDVI